MKRNHRVSVFPDAVAERPQQARFSDSRLTGQEHAAHLSVDALLPTLSDHIEFRAPANERCHAITRPDLEAVDRVCLRQHALHQNRTGDALQFLPAEVFQQE
jgi:hypothetical protein